MADPAGPWMERHARSAAGEWVWWKPKGYCGSRGRDASSSIGFENAAVLRVIDPPSLGFGAASEDETDGMATLTGIESD
jgi:hypothetical protein